VEVDGHRQRVSVTGAGRSRQAWPLPLGPGWHTLRVFKTSDAAVGHVALTGLELEAGAGLRAPAAERHPVSMLFFGDSITVGACNEDGATDQWDDHSTHNNARSYGALTAARFNADYRNLAISGMGICEGYVEILAHQAWDALYPEVGSPRAPADGWKPDLIFVNLGENDSSFSKNAGHAFPAGYTDGLVALARRIRADHPQARIILLRGGMWGGALDPALLAAWEKAVARIETADTSASHFAFRHWSAQHPRVADDEAMARELAAWLGDQPWMRDLSSAR
jgi:lysophospholipase L1-like esterase